MIWKRCSTAWFLGGWKVLRPIIEPLPPPSRTARTSAKTPSRSFASPPEKTTMRRPLKADCTTCLMRAAEVEMCSRRLDLDDMRAELRGDLSGIGAHVDRGLALARQVATARVGPDHDGQPI